MENVERREETTFKQKVLEKGGVVGKREQGFEGDVEKESIGQ